jgi:flagellar motor protein MotB
VAEQLKIEQRHSLEAKDRLRQLEILAERLQKRLKVCELERDQACEKLDAAHKILPVAPSDAGQLETADRSVLVGVISFRAGQETLADSDRQELTGLAAQVVKMGEGDIVVAGHSDPTPIGKTKFESNMHLSAVRALAVYHALVEMPGIVPENVYVSAYGEFKPDGAGNRLRRVEIRFIPAGL